MRVGVGPAAIKMGLVGARNDVTLVRARAVNTVALFIGRVRTPERQVIYTGDTMVDGVLGTAAPALLELLEAVGSCAGALFPTGQCRKEINGIEVTCVDFAMPMTIVRPRRSV